MKVEKEEVIFENAVRNVVLPVKEFDTFKAGDTNPSVLNLETWIANNTVGGTIIQKFINGAESQRIKILGDGFTQVANNANIVTNTGAAKLLLAGLVYRFTFIKNVWHEDVDTAGGGVGPQGIQGIPGIPGSTFVVRDGKSGKDGFPGAQGNPGSTGNTGAAGLDGKPIFVKDGKDGRDGFSIPGKDGKDGKDGKGFLAIDGKKGVDGFTIPGKDGKDGLQGIQGVPGIDGKTNIALDGKKGDFGFPGNAGKDGVQGIPGINGIDGKSILALDGKQGPMGFPIPGQKGIDGINGTNGLNGRDGQSLLVRDGRDGSWGFPGQKGDKGDQGIQGVPGSGGGSSSLLVPLPFDGKAGAMGFPGPPGSIDGTKISALSAVSSALLAQEYPVNDSGTTKKVTHAQLLALVGDSLGNASSATQAPAAATLTYLTGSSIAIPVGKLRIGTQFLWFVDMTKSAAGVAARTFHVRLGVNGNTTDTAILTFTSALGTAVIDQAWMEILVTIRGPLSASCIARGALHFDHELPATGFMTVKSEALGVTSGVFDATVANLIIGLSVTTGAAEVITFQQILAEAKNL